MEREDDSCRNFIIGKSYHLLEILMIRIQVHSFPRGKIDDLIELPEGSTALDLFRVLNLRPDSWILIREDKVIPDDTSLRDNDSIKLLSVISGG